MEDGWIDIGYQIVCSVTGLKFRQVVDWLAEQIGYTFENGDTITMIESFQVIRDGPYHDCIAVCRVERPYPDGEEPGTWITRNGVHAEAPEM